MPLNLENTASIVQSALLAAGAEDRPQDRQLAQLHLPRYVHPADLVRARRDAEEAPAGADWRFPKFGPGPNAVVEAMAWRDELAAAPPVAEGVSAKPSDDLWNAPTRKGGGVP